MSHIIVVCVELSTHLKRSMDMKSRKQVAIASITLASLAALSLAPIASAQEGPKGEGHKPGERMEHRMKKRAHKIEHRLDKLVKEGKITESQKVAIEAKLKENKGKLKEIHNIENRDERRGAIKKLHQDFKQWLTDQGIDAELLKPNKPNKS